MFNKTKTIHITLLSISILAISLIGLLAITKSPVYASDNDFSNGITVDSKVDGADSNVGDNICDDGSGNCTLRAAIEESNATAGTQTINFNITGTADFTNSGQNGYTIQPASGLPVITDTVTINGYSQPGAQANTAVAPNPLNGVLLIEIDGSGAGNADGIRAASNNTVVQGLIMNGFNSVNRKAISTEADDITIHGNYLGTEPDGMTAAANYCGVCVGTPDPDNILIGGLNPENRNIISGNTSTGASPNGNGDGWIFQGNYVGVGKDGMTAVPNAQSGGAGAFSIDNSDNHIVGGNQTGAINVISGNLGIGIAPHNTDNLLIEGNYIGLAHDGVTVVGNAPGGDGGGIGLSDSDNFQIINNDVAGWTDDGIGIYTNTNGTIQNNRVFSNGANGVSISNADNIAVLDNEVYNQQSQGINVNNSSNVTIATNNIQNNDLDGVNINNNSTNTDIEDNTIDGNTENGIEIDNSSDVTITTNNIQNNDLDGVNINNNSTNTDIEDNTIDGNTENGIEIDNSTDTTMTNNTIQNNDQDGISISGSSTNTNVEDNTIEGNTENGIEIDNSSDVTITTNNILNNELYGIYRYYIK